MNAETRATRARPFQFKLQLLFLLTACVAIGSCVGVTVTRTIELNGVTPAEANEAFAATVSVVRVPDNARNVDVFAYFQSGQAAFDISESDFVEYVRSRPWNLVKLDLKPNVPASFQFEGHLDSWPEDLQHILYFTNSSHRGGWTVMYDRDRQRAYINFSAR